MAEKVEIEVPGIGKIEATNAATETTLRELVDAIKGLQKSTDKNARDAKKGQEKKTTGGGADAPNVKKLDKGAQDAGKSINAVSRAARVAGTTMTAAGKAAQGAAKYTQHMAHEMGRASRMADQLTSRMGNMANSITGLIDDIAGVGDSLTSAAATMRNIPVVGGVLANVFGAVAVAATSVAQAYQSAAGVGATFGGSVNEMARAASTAGMTLDQFGQLLASNGENLMLLGGTTEQGAKRLTQLSKSMQQSGLQAELLRMGYSTKDVNEGMLKYAGLMGKTGALQNMSTDQIARGSASYLKELDALAKVTGQSRQAKQAEMDALMADAKVRAALAGIQDPEQQKKMMAYITSFPKEAQGAIADMIATGNMTTEEAVKLGTMLPGAAKQAMEFGRTLQRGGKISDQQMNQAKNTAILEARASVKRNQVLGQYSDQFGNAYVASANLAAQQVDGYSKALGEQAKATEDANLAEEVEKAKQQLAKVSNSFLLFLANSGMINTLTTAFQALASFAQAVLMPAFTMLTTAINFLTPIIAGTLIPAFQILGDWIGNAIVPIFQAAYDIVANTVGAIFDFFGITTAATDGMAWFEETLYVISDFIMDNLEPIMAGLALVTIPMLIGKISTVALSLGTMALNVVKNVIGLGMMAIKFLPLIAIGALLYLAFKGITKAVGSFSDVIGHAGDVFKIVMSFIKTGIFTVFKGILSLVNKIPGFRGDFDNAIKGLDDQIKEESDSRAQSYKSMEDRKKRSDAAKDAEEAAASKKAEDKEESRRQRATEREERRRERAHNRQMQGIGEREERERRAEEAKNQDPSQDLSDPINMLRSFAERNKSAFTEEAKALDAVDAARKESVEANRAYNDAEQAVRKAKTDDERKAAEEALKNAKDRREKAMAAEKDADKAAESAAARMKAAKEGKDTGPTRRESAPATAATGGAPESAAVRDLGDKFGRVAAHFEAGGKAGTISSGHGDFGGKSYGAFQLAGRGGRAGNEVEQFLKASGFEKQFQGMKVGSAEFDKKWREMAQDKKFEQAQYDFAKKQHYDPQAKKLAGAGVDLSGRGTAVQEAIMSTANQYGANTDLILKALKGKDTAQMSDKDIINAIQDYKAETVKTRFKSSSAAVQAGVAKRIEQERSMLLGMEGGKAAPGGAPNVVGGETGERRPGRGTPATPGARGDRAAAVEGPASPLQSLVDEGIKPTTLAFQDLNKKAIAPMMAAGMQFAKFSATAGKPVPETPGVIDRIKTALGSSANDLKYQQTLKAAELAKGEAKAKTEPRMSELAAQEAAKAVATAVPKFMPNDMARKNDPVYQELVKKNTMGKGPMAEREAIKAADMQYRKMWEANLGKGSATELAAAGGKKSNAVPSSSQVEQSVKDQSDAESKRLQAANDKVKTEAQNQLAQSGLTGGGIGQGQETPESLLASLNMKMDELISISKQQADIGSKQLSVAKSNSGDLFA